MQLSKLQRLARLYASERGRHVVTFRPADQELLRRQELGAYIFRSAVAGVFCQSDLSDDASQLRDAVSDIRFLDFELTSYSVDVSDELAVHEDQFDWFWFLEHLGVAPQQVFDFSHDVVDGLYFGRRCLGDLSLDDLEFLVLVSCYNTK